LDKIEVGKRLKTAREVFGVLTDQKFTQDKLADMTQQSRSYIGDIETGRTYPTLAVLFDISEKTGIPVEYFISEKYQLKDYLFNKKSDIDKLIEAYLNLSEVSRQTVWNLINSLAIIDKTQKEQSVNKEVG
jgi:transcriptional regulator with XRE-family HTH domain